MTWVSTVLSIYKNCLVFKLWNFDLFHRICICVWRFCKFFSEKASFLKIQNSLHFLVKNQPYRQNLIIKKMLCKTITFMFRRFFLRLIIFYIGNRFFLKSEIWKIKIKKIWNNESKRVYTNLADLMQNAS